MHLRGHPTKEAMLIEGPTGHTRARSSPSFSTVTTKAAGAAANVEAG